jgi:hypothetical protein
MYDERTKKISLINLEAECRFEKQKNHENFLRLRRDAKKKYDENFLIRLRRTPKRKKTFWTFIFVKNKKVIKI